MTSLDGPKCNHDKLITDQLKLKELSPICLHGLCYGNRLSSV